MVLERDNEPGVRRSTSASTELCDFGQVTSPLSVSVCSSGKMREEMTSAVFFQLRPGITLPFQPRKVLLEYFLQYL